MFCKISLSVAIFFPSFHLILPPGRPLKKAANGKFTVKQFLLYFLTN